MSKYLVYPETGDPIEILAKDVHVREDGTLDFYAEDDYRGARIASFPHNSYAAHAKYVGKYPVSEGKLNKPDNERRI